MLLAIPFIVFLGLMLFFWHARRDDDTKPLRAIKNALSLIFAALAVFIAWPLTLLLNSNLHARKLWKHLNHKG